MTTWRGHGVLRSSVVPVAREPRINLSMSPSTPFPDEGARLGRSGGQYAIVRSKECKFEAIGNPRLVINIAQIILDHLFGSAQAKPNLFVLATLHEQGNDLQFLWGQPIAYTRPYGSFFVQPARFAHLLNRLVALDHLVQALHQLLNDSVAVNHSANIVSE